MKDLYIFLLSRRYVRFRKFSTDPDEPPYESLYRHIIKSLVTPPSPQIKQIQYSFNLDLKVAFECREYV